MFHAKSDLLLITYEPWEEHVSNSLLVFGNKNRELFQSNSEIHEINTRYNQYLHLPSTNLTLVQKGYCIVEARSTVAYH